MPTALSFADAPLVEILAYLRQELDAGADEIALRVADPDRAAGHFAGERLGSGEHNARAPAFIHRPFRVWVDVAERMRLRLATPRATADGLLTLRFFRLQPRAWAQADPPDPTEKYGAQSGYGQIRKHEDPGFVLDLHDALARARLPPQPRILDLGVNTADSLALITALRPWWQAEQNFVGIDHSASALAIARRRFPDARFVHADLAALPSLALPRFDLVLSVGTLQSPGIDDRAVLRHVVQQCLTDTGAVILGVPNCSYVDGEVLYGAKMKNFTQPDLSLLVKNVAFYRKYLQQHRRRVFVTGKHYVLVTGVVGCATIDGEP